MFSSGPGRLSAPSCTSLNVSPSAVEQYEWLQWCHIPSRNHIGLAWCRQGFGGDGPALAHYLHCITQQSYWPIVCTLADTPLALPDGHGYAGCPCMVRLVLGHNSVEQVGEEFAPRSPRVFLTSVGISSGPVALPLFIFSMASFTSAIMIQGTGPRVGVLELAGVGTLHCRCQRNTLTIDEEWMAGLGWLGCQLPWLAWHGRCLEWSSSETWQGCRCYLLLLACPIGHTSPGNGDSSQWPLPVSLSTSATGIILSRYRVAWSSRSCMLMFSL